MTFYRVMLEIARGSPGIGWCLTLGASHAALIAAHWPEQAQIELFGATGHFIAPHRAGIPVEIEHADGGYRVTGKWAYASGCPYSTHFLGNAVIKADNGAEPKPVTFIVPRDAYTILDDWGGDATLGMRASGSNTVVLDDVFVPEHMVVESRPALWSADDLPNGTPGTRLHGNPMYLGRFAGPYHASLVVPVIGAARAALEELKGIAERRTTRFPPFQPWTKNPDVQRPFGEALLLTDTAEALLTRACEMYMEYCRRWDADGTPFTVEDSMRLWGILIKAGRMATEATEIVFDTASSSAAMKGQRLERYYRDIGMYRGHSSSQFQTFAAGIARIHFGDPMGLFGV
jgi:3-hydroxy-9,10-secoandrosta-1,3,5(10)-triene-9,17-dione monooxygenase